VGELMRGFLDRDFIRTVENLIFCVIGGVHPRNRVISYLKYAPNPKGRWGKDRERYARTMRTYTIPSLLKNIDILTNNYPQHVFKSRVLRIKMSAVPRRRINEHYLPETKLEELLTSKKPDILQEQAFKLVSYLSEKSGISMTSFGVTGSILIDIHQQNFSDIDLVIYGYKNSIKVKETLVDEFQNKEVIFKVKSKEELEKLQKRWSTNYSISLVDAQNFYKRRWNFGYIDDTAFSIHPVKTRKEIKEKYGVNRFFPKKIVKGTARITDVSESLFLPCKYRIEKFEFNKTKMKKEINHVISYDGFYSGIFDNGDTIEIKGKLERVLNKKTGENSYRILIGSPEARGQDYIKPLKTT
jgi:predicted nucleotidyltransferase